MSVVVRLVGRQRAQRAAATGPDDHVARSTFQLEVRRRRRSFNFDQPAIQKLWVTPKGNEITIRRSENECAPYMGLFWMKWLSWIASQKVRDHDSDDGYPQR